MTLLVGWGGRLALDGSAIIIGGVLYELRDAWQNPHGMSFMDRIKRLLGILFENMRSQIKNKGAKELCLEIATGLCGLAAGMFKNLKSLFKTLGQGLHQLSNKIWEYITGKINSVEELVSASLKIFAAIGISSCVLLAEEYLAVHFPWIPRIVSGLLATAVGGLAIVFANRGIDMALAALVGMLSEAKVAAMHREQVEAYIKEKLPGILEESERIEKYANVWLQNMADSHKQSFAAISASFYNDSEMFRQQLNTHARNMGIAEIEDDFLDDLENELMDFANEKHTK